MDALTLSAQQAEDLDGLVAGGAEPVREPCVEFGDFARPHGDVVVGEDETHLSAQHIEPFVSLVGAEFGFFAFGWDDHFPGMRPTRILRERDDNAAFADLRCQPDPGIADLRRSDQFVERDLVGLGDREQQLEAGFALPGFEPGQGALGDPSCRGKFGEGHAPLGSCPLEARADFGQHVSDRSWSLHSASQLYAAPRTERDSRKQQQKLACTRGRRTLASEVTTVNTHNEMYDVVIVGGGAAGLSAALVLGRARRRVLVVDGGAPRNAPAAHMQGFLSRDGMPPAELLAAGRAEVIGYGVEIVADQVLAIESGFSVRLAVGRVVVGRRLLVATGVGDELPDIPGVRERWGKDLLHCPYCHGWEVRDQPLGVLGTHPMSVLHAQLVRQWSDDVTYFAHTYDLTATEQTQLEARGIRIARGEVARLVIDDDRLTGVELSNGQVIARTAVFIRPGNLPHADGLLAGLGCELDAAGFVIVDATGATSTPGVWAAGNVADPRAQVITAAGAGSAAAIAINADLVQDDVERAVHDHDSASAARND